MTRLLTLQPESVTRLRLRNGSTHRAPNPLLALLNHPMPWGWHRLAQKQNRVHALILVRKPPYVPERGYSCFHHRIIHSLHAFASPTFHRVPTVGAHGHTQARRVVFLASPSCTTDGTVRGGASYS